MSKCLLVVNAFKGESSDIASQIGSFLAERGWDVGTFSYNGQEALKNGVSTVFDGVDLAVSLGGDGTVLFVSRGCAPLGIPVFAVNLGEFGFLASIQRNGWRKPLAEYLGGNLPSISRYMVVCRVIRDGVEVFSSNGLNDMTISSEAASRLINLDVSYAGSNLGPFKANGIIVATATGSTAYSAAAGGPIISPGLKALVLTPISSFSLSARPLVFSADGTLSVRVLPSRAKIGLMADGQINFELKEDDTVLLGIPNYKVKLLGGSLDKFYSALQSKLNWSGGPRA